MKRVVFGLMLSLTLLSLSSAYAADCWKLTPSGSCQSEYGNTGDTDPCGPCFWLQCHKRTWIWYADAADWALTRGDTHLEAEGGPDTYTQRIDKTFKCWDSGVCDPTCAGPFPDAPIWRCMVKLNNPNINVIHDDFVGGTEPCIP